MFAIPAVLSALFLAVAAHLNAFSFPLAALILAYTFLPMTVAYLARHHPPPTWPDFAVIALLWFPLEFSLGHQFIPKQAQSVLHLTAYGVAILLALSIFLRVRRLTGIKINLPRSTRDFVNLFIGFAFCAPILIPLGRAIGFLPPFHFPPNASIARIGSQYLIILAITALPEEILFRSLIQNCIAQRFGVNTYNALALRLHLRMRASGQRPWPATQLALHDPSHHRRNRLWKGLREKLQHLRFSRIARAGGRH